MEHAKSCVRLYDYGARYYAAWICRFISVDPLQFEYPYYTPYQYAGNMPISYIDLDGLEPAKFTGGMSYGLVFALGNQDVRVSNKLSVYGAMQSKYGSAEAGANLNIGTFIHKFGKNIKGGDMNFQWYAGVGYGNNQNMLGWQNPPTSVNTPMLFNNDTKGGYGGVAIGQTFFKTSGSLGELDNTVGSVFVRGGGSNFNITLNVYNDVQNEVLNKFFPLPFLGGGTDLGITGGGGISGSWISGDLKYTVGLNLETITPVRGENNNIKDDIRADGTVATYGIFETLGVHQDLYHQNVYLYGSVSGALNMSLKVGTDDHFCSFLGNVQDNIHLGRGETGLFSGWDKNYEKPFFEFSATPFYNNTIGE